MKGTDLEMSNVQCYQVMGVWRFVEETRRRGHVDLVCWGGRTGIERETPRRLRLLNWGVKRRCSRRRCTAGRRGNANRYHRSAGPRRISRTGEQTR